MVETGVIGNQGLGRGTKDESWGESGLGFDGVETRGVGGPVFQGEHGSRSGDRVAGRPGGDRGVEAGGVGVPEPVVEPGGRDERDRRDVVLAGDAGDRGRRRRGGGGGPERERAVRLQFERAEVAARRVEGSGGGGAGQQFVEVRTRDVGGVGVEVVGGEVFDRTLEGADVVAFRAEDGADGVGGGDGEDDAGGGVVGAAGEEAAGEGGVDADAVNLAAGVALDELAFAEPGGGRECRGPCAGR
jgi:hypothetical protein